LQRTNLSVLNYFLQGKNRFEKPIFASEGTIIDVFDSHTATGQEKPT
jgi:hypothetical protein